MPIDVEKHFGHPVPYAEFSPEEIAMAISDARISIDGLKRNGTKRSRRTIKILQDNINKLEKLRGKSA